VFSEGPIRSSDGVPIETGVNEVQLPAVSLN
jgi:hypothetical protein